MGSEISKTRPCVIISPNEINKYLNTITIAPMTSTSKSYPTRVAIDHDKKKVWVVIDQIRTVDRRRIIRILGNLSTSEITKVKSVLKETFVD